ncbi:MAG: hypothetical protein CMC05_15700 [Flavobacteriaceae bacterium]|nr:hypothetical protein [Flavobacteriaceae bacterium]MBD10917.1 hypothetical protein [Flavobacteriaceae bacterium]|tara:strand:+ start:1446 stop:2279 length:834 start_codon:yes stop_codon:yes gene_type:complete
MKIYSFITKALLLSFTYCLISSGQNFDRLTVDSSTTITNSFNPDVDSNSDDRPKIRLLFTSIGIINREILLTVDDRCTDGYDWGFDGYLNDVQVDDMSWLIEDDLFVIQGIGDIDAEETTLPLSIQKSDVGDVVIAIQALENFPDDLDIILHDTELGTHYDLRNANYEASLPAGIYEDRFVLGFQNPSQLSVDDNEEEQLDFYYATNRNKLVVLNPRNTTFKNIEIYNITGKSAYKIEDVLDGSYNEYSIDNLTAGIYVVRLHLEDNKIVTKKIIVK